MIRQPGAAISLQDDVQHFVTDTLARCREIAAHGNAIFDNLLRLENRLPPGLDSFEFRRQLPPHVQVAVVEVFNRAIQPHQRSAPKIRKACEKWNVEKGVLFFYLGHTNSIAFWSAIKDLSDACSSWPEALNNLHHAARTRRSGLLPRRPGVIYDTPGFLVFDVVQTCRLMGGLVSTERQTLNRPALPRLLPPARSDNSSQTTETESMSASSAFRAFPGSTRAVASQEQPSSSIGTGGKADSEAHGERQQPNGEQAEIDSRRPVGARTDSVDSSATPSTELMVSTRSQATTAIPTLASDPNSQTNTTTTAKPTSIVDLNSEPSTTVTVKPTSAASPTSAANPNAKTDTTTISKMSLDGNQKKRPAESECVESPSSFKDMGVLTLPGTSNEESTAKKSKTTPATGHASTASVTDAGAHISPDKLMTCLKKIAIAHSDVMVVNPQLLDDIAAGGHDAPQDVKDTVKTFSSFIMPLRINQHDWTMTFLVVDAEEPRAQFHDPAASITNAEEAKRVVAAFLLQFFPHRAPDLLLFSRSFTPAYGLTSAKDSGVIMFLIVVSDRFAPISVNISLWRYVMAVLLGESSDWSELLSLDRKPPDMPEEPVRESGASTLQLMEWKREHDEWWYHRMEALMARAASDMNDAYESLNTVVEARTSLKPVLQAMKIRQTKALGHEKQTSCPKASEKALEELERVITEISNVLSRLKNKEDELRTVAQECAEEKKQLSLFS